MEDVLQYHIIGFHYIMWHYICPKLWVGPKWVCLTMTPWTSWQCNHGGTSAAELAPWALLSCQRKTPYDGWTAGLLCLPFPSCCTLVLHPLFLLWLWTTESLNGSQGKDLKTPKISKKQNKKRHLMHIHDWIVKNKTATKKKKSHN